MKPVSGKHLCKVLQQHGWVLIRIHGSHHLYGRPNHPAILSVPVHGNRDLPIGTQRALMRLAGLTEDDL
jgi:predicted RNA binding protein YcfA (HicA-like mRNA interferase family)